MQTATLKDDHNIAALYTSLACAATTQQINKYEGATHGMPALSRVTTSADTLATVLAHTAARRQADPALVLHVHLLLLTYGYGLETHSANQVHLSPATHSFLYSYARARINTTVLRSASARVRGSSSEASLRARL